MDCTKMTVSALVCKLLFADNQQQEDDIIQELKDRGEL